MLYYQSPPLPSKTPTLPTIAYSNKKKVQLIHKTSKHTYAYRPFLNQREIKAHPGIKRIMEGGRKYKGAHTTTG